MATSLASMLGGAARLILPRGVRRKLTRLTRYPPVGSVEFGDLGRTSPISREWGFDRGKPVDRFFIEGFMTVHSADIRGRVLEVADNEYTRRFGGDNVTVSDILHDSPGSPRATVVADLAVGDPIPSDTYDCVICTQTLHLIYDVEAAIATLHRILKPGGTLLATLPVITQISRIDMERNGDFWRFTSAAARRLFEEGFPGGEIEVGAHGNVVAAVAFLQGIASEELDQEQLHHCDPDYEVLITIRAVKSQAAP
jgi:SAM-dependent methyltransferase